MSSRPPPRQSPQWHDFPVLSSDPPPLPGAPRRWSEQSPEPFYLRRNPNLEPLPILPPRPRRISHYHPNPADTEPSAIVDSNDPQAVWAFPEPHPAPDSGASPNFQSNRSSAFWNMDEPFSPDTPSFPLTLPDARDYIVDEESHFADMLARLQRFQEGELAKEEEEWHKLCSETIIKSLPKKEVQRQSTIFEVVKSERDYTLDLQLVDNVFIRQLLIADPPVISPPEELQGFIDEVFYNLNEIVTIHERMVRSLFERQHAQHPVIESISDIVLDASLSFQPEYERYMKHYPLAEGRHRQEVKNNRAYRAFLEKCSQDTRISKRDLITFISRPVTRLPRLNLMVQNILKLTPPDHEDLEELNLILGVLSQFIKSTQPGIAAAEGKAKLLNIAESLVFDKGEIIDLDIHNEYRTLMYQGNLARQRSRTWGSGDGGGWSDLVVALLDNYFLMTQPRTFAGVTQHVLVSRPIPLEFLRIGAFNTQPEQRKEENEPGESERGFLGRTFRSKETVPLYPFMVWHGAASIQRRYTLFAASEATRAKWKAALEEAIFLRKAQSEANRYFATEPISEEFFRSKTMMVPSDSSRRFPAGYFTGKMTCAARFVRDRRTLFAIGCGLGIFVGYQSNFKAMKKVINLSNPTDIAVLDELDRLLVLYDGSLLSYPLTPLIKVAQTGQPLPSTTMQRLDTRDGTILFFRVGVLDGKTVVVYGVRSFRQVTVEVLEVTGGTLLSSSPGTQLTPTTSQGPRSLRPYGSPVFVPRDASGVTILQKTIGIGADHMLVIANPLKTTSDRVSIVPDFAETATNDASANALKTRCQNNVPLGIVRSGENELLVVYDTFGCYISKHGDPVRKCQYVRWETKVTSWTASSPHILLFSSDFIEVRLIPTGRLLQVIEGQNIRFLNSATQQQDPILVATKGDTDDQTGLTDKLVELVETKSLEEGPDAVFLDTQWGEWDN